MCSDFYHFHLRYWPHWPDKHVDFHLGRFAWNRNRNQMKVRVKSELELSSIVHMAQNLHNICTKAISLLKATSISSRGLLRTLWKFREISLAALNAEPHRLYKTVARFCRNPWADPPGYPWCSDHGAMCGCHCVVIVSHVTVDMLPLQGV